MPTYNLGELVILDHDVEKVTDALAIPEGRFDSLVEKAQEAFEYEVTISESIEWLAQRLSGSELALSLVFLGRFWESSQDETE